MEVRMSTQDIKRYIDRKIKAGFFVSFLCILSGVLCVLFSYCRMNVCVGFFLACNIFFLWRFIVLRSQIKNLCQKYKLFGGE